MENYREGVPTTIFGSMPDPEMVKSLDFSQLQYWTGSSYATETLYDPYSLHDNGSGTLVRNTLSGNKINNPNLDSLKVAQKILSYFPSPNRPSPTGENPWQDNYMVFNKNTEQYHNVLVKWDQNIGQSDRFFLRWGTWQRFENYNSNGIFNDAAAGHMPHGERSQTFAGDWIHTFNSHFIVDTRATVISRNDFQVTGGQNYDDIAGFGWPEAMKNQMGAFQAFPHMNFSEYTGMGSATPTKHVANSLALAPSATLIQGRHTVRFGIDLRLLQDVNKLNSGGLYFYADRTWTQRDYLNWDQPSGNSIASFLEAGATSGNFGIPATSYYSRHYFAPWLQDDWKVTNALTLNLGLRYDFNLPISERHNAGTYIFDTRATNPVDTQVDHSLLPNRETLIGGVTFLGVNGSPRTMYRLDKMDIQPRIGFAYAVNSKTTARGGVGLMIGNQNPQFQQPGFSRTTDYLGSVDGNKTPANNMATPFPDGIAQPTGSAAGMETGLGSGPSFVNPNFRNPKYWQYSIGFERQLTKSAMVNASYVGTRTLDNPTTDNINRTSAAWAAKCNIARGGDHNLCDGTSAYVPNPFYQVPGFLGTSDYSSPTIRNDAFTRPFPQFGDIMAWNLNEGKSWYNSFQVSGVQRWNQALTIHANWTWSKQIDAGGWTDTTYRVPYRSLDGNDRTHRITLSGVYRLPVGRGYLVLRNANRWLNTAVGGWELAPMFT